MPNFCLRIDDFGNKEVIIRFVTDVLKASGLGCEERPPSGNLHYHFMLLTPKTLDATRKSIQKLLKDNDVKGGNAAYSLKNKPGNENYLCKGYTAEKLYKGTNMPQYDVKSKSAPLIVWNTEGYSNEDILEFHNSFWEDQKDLRKPKTQAEDKKSSFMKKIEYCKSKGITSKSDGWQIAEAMIDYYRELMCCAPGDYQLKVISQSLADHFQYEKFIDPNASDKVKQSYLLYRKRRAIQIMGGTWTNVDL